MYFIVQYVCIYYYTHIILYVIRISIVCYVHKCHLFMHNNLYVMKCRCCFTQSGITVLHTAALGGRENLIRWLVEQGADINATNKVFSLVMHFVAITLLQIWRLGCELNEISGNLFATRVSCNNYESPIHEGSITSASLFNGCFEENVAITIAHSMCAYNMRECCHDQLNAHCVQSILSMLLSCIILRMYVSSTQVRHIVCALGMYTKDMLCIVCWLLFTNSLL